MSNWINEQSFLLKISINHFETESVFLKWSSGISFSLIFSMINLPTLLSSFFAGLINRHYWLLIINRHYWLLIWNNIDNVDLKYTNNKSKQRKTGKWNRIWFNPPFNKSVSTNVAKTFLQLITKHFPRSHKLHKIFNRNTVKVSYSCMNNMSKIIKGHNKKVTSKPRDQRPKCNCRKKAECPMEGNCLVNDVVYKCDITRTSP